MKIEEALSMYEKTEVDLINFLLNREKPYAISKWGNSKLPIKTKGIDLFADIDPGCKVVRDYIDFISPFETCLENHFFFSLKRYYPNITEAIEKIGSIPRKEYTKFRESYAHVTEEIEKEFAEEQLSKMSSDGSLSALKTFVSRNDKTNTLGKPDKGGVDNWMKDFYQKN